MQIKTMTYHLMTVRLAIVRKSTNNKCGRRCGGKGTPPVNTVDRNIDSFSHLEDSEVP